jgi:LysR family transcriptional activator of glutamate synthase operon
MDIQQLRVFRVAARAGGFTRASEELNLSQSTVSQHIKQLEDGLGCSLFLRVGKRVHLNESGKLLLQYSDKIFSEIKNAEMAVRELNTLQRGTIRLGSSTTPLIYLLPRILGGYKKSYPQIELILVTGTSEVLLQSLSAQTIDMAIVMERTAHSQSIRIIPAMRDELVVVLNAGHPLATKEILEADDLRSLPFINHMPGTSIHSLLESYFESMNVRPKVTMELENVEAIKGLIRAGLGASVLPRCSVGGVAQSAALKALRIRGFPMERELGLALPKSDILPIAIRKLASWILKGLSSRTSGARGDAPISF